MAQGKAIQEILDSYKVLVPDFPAHEEEILATREKLTTVNRELWISEIKRLREEAMREMKAAARNEESASQIQHYLNMAGLPITEWRMFLGFVCPSEEDMRKTERMVQFIRRSEI